MIFGTAHGSAFGTRLRRAAWLSTFSFVTVAALAGCEDTMPDEEKGPTGDVVLKDDNNYRSVSVLTLPIIPTAPGVDLEICWDELDVDMQCHGIDPSADIDKIAMLRFRGLEKEEAEALLVSGELTMSDLDAYIQYNTDGEETCASLGEMTLVSGTAIDPEEHYTESEDQLYMLLLGSTTTPGIGARTLLFVNPTSDSDVDSIDIGPACTDEGSILEFSAELRDAADINDGSQWTVGWREVTRDSIGNELLVESIDRALLGFYAGKTVADIEAEILDIELIADELWETELNNVRAVDLRTLLNESGDAFDGFAQHGEGTWLFALLCSTCQNPAPVVLTVLNPT